MPLLLIPPIVFVVLYVSLILLFLRGWLNTPTHRYSPPANLPVSIILPVRNEEHRVKQAIHSITQQDYPAEWIELLVVNDHSSDQTAEVVSALKVPGLRLVHLSNKEQGKKAAIRRGVSLATHPLIITLDADVQVKQQWLKTLTAFYQQNHAPRMLICPVLFESKQGFFNAFMELEFLSLVASGAGSAGIGQPILCNGANLAFNKELYLQAPLDEHPSGDDIFLLLHAKKVYPGSIRFLKSREAVATTPAPATIREFLRQRIRWSSKNSRCRDFFYGFTAVTVLLTNISILCCYVTLCCADYRLASLAIIGIKWLADLLLLSSVASFFKQTRLLAWFLPVALLYPFYIVLAAMGGFFFRFSWKGRRYA